MMKNTCKHITILLFTTLSMSGYTELEINANRHVITIGDKSTSNPDYASPVSMIEPYKAPKFRMVSHLWFAGMYWPAQLEETRPPPEPQILHLTTPQSPITNDLGQGCCLNRLNRGLKRAISDKDKNLPDYKF